MPKPRMSPDAFFVSARCYVETAFAVALSRARRDEFTNDVRYGLPTLMLLGHAAELYLKSWLLGTGAISQTELENRPYGHNLKELYTAAKRVSMPEPDMPANHSISDLINSLAPDHSAYSYRYPADNFVTQMWKLSSAFRVFSAWDSALRDAINGQKPTFEEWRLDEGDDYRIPTL